MGMNEKMTLAEQMKGKANEYNSSSKEVVKKTPSAFAKPKVDLLADAIRDTKARKKRFKVFAPLSS